jgi:hypothetical protein
MRHEPIGTLLRAGGRTNEAFGYYLKWIESGGRMTYPSQTPQQFVSDFYSLRIDKAALNAKANFGMDDKIVWKITDSVNDAFEQTSRSDRVPALWGWQHLPGFDAYKERFKSSTEKFVSVFIDKNGKAIKVSESEASAALASWVIDSGARILLSEFLWQSMN